jgi:hypothetical protein
MLSFANGGAGPRLRKVRRFRDLLTTSRRAAAAPPRRPGKGLRGQVLCNFDYRNGERPLLLSVLAYYRSAPTPSKKPATTPMRRRGSTVPAESSGRAGDVAGGSPAVRTAEGYLGSGRGRGCPGRPFDRTGAGGAAQRRAGPIGCDEIQSLRWVVGNWSRLTHERPPEGPAALPTPVEIWSDSNHPMQQSKARLGFASI